MQDLDKLGNELKNNELVELSHTFQTNNELKIYINMIKEFITIRKGWLFLSKQNCC